RLDVHYRSPNGLWLSGARRAPPSDDNPPRTACSGTAARVRCSDEMDSSFHIDGIGVPMWFGVIATLFEGGVRGTSYDHRRGSGKFRVGGVRLARPRPSLPAKAPDAKPVRPLLDVAACGHDSDGGLRHRPLLGPPGRKRRPPCRAPARPACLPLPP